MTDKLILDTSETWWRGLPKVAGMDIGRHGDPSHCSVFAVVKIEDSPDSIVQVHQKFLDGWEYTRQVEYLKAAIEYFGIDKVYFDNTRGEFEERDLPRECIPIVISSSDGPKSKSKFKMAMQFLKLVEQKRIKLIDDDRYLSQILCVTNNLQAPRSQYGHGDSFISVILACAAYEDFFSGNKGRFSFIGNVQNLIEFDNKIKKPEIIVPSIRRDSIINCPLCGKKLIQSADIVNKKICDFCMTSW